MKRPTSLISFLILSAIAFMLTAPDSARAAWIFDGTAVSTAANGQHSPAIVSDGVGGVIIAWVDDRDGTHWDVYAQRLDPDGTPLWTANGVVICSATGDQFSPMIASDGGGGAIVVWQDHRGGTTNADVYAQRVNSLGVTQWAIDGVGVSTAANYQSRPTVVSDGAGGAIVAWQDYRSGSGTDTSDIYAQRVSPSGVVQWTVDGVSLCTAMDYQNYPTIAADGAGGAIVAWQDNRSGATNSDIYAQRVNPSGATQWTADGVALCTAWDNQGRPEIVADVTGGAIVAWTDSRDGDTNSDVYAQRVNAFGITQWTVEGVAICTASNEQGGGTIVADDAGGAIIAWYDFRGAGGDVYAQRVNASGSPLWKASGVAVCTAVDGQYYSTVVSDGAGGGIVTWMDHRSGTRYDIYAQRVNDSGWVEWTTDGVALSTSTLTEWPPTITADGTGGAVVTWTDLRTGVTDIYAQRVEGAYGYWGRPEPIVTSVADIPNDQGGSVAVNWVASGRDRPVPRTISHYSIWRAVDEMSLSARGGAPVAVADLAQFRMDSHGPVFIVLRSVPEYYWKLVATQSAQGWPGYSFSAPTRADSVAGDSALEFFMVAAHDKDDDYVAFASNALSGHSVDNLAPAAPLQLAAQRIGSDVHLRWNRVRVPDLRDYAVYRKTSAGVTPVLINFLSSADDTLLTDTNAPANALYYIVTAYDVHMNQSAASDEVSVGATTGGSNLPAITTLTVLQNHPNPFAGVTEMEIGLVGNSDVKIEVYDVAGRKVRGETLAPRKAGWDKVAFDGRDDAGHLLASGVYFYRVHANGGNGHAQNGHRALVVAS